ncbi:hypothetical protein FRC02_003037, partial [Tulasnella sp. 418]
MVVSRESSAQPRVSLVGRKPRTHPTYNPDANYGRLTGKMMNIGELERDTEGYEDIDKYLQADAFFSPEPAVRPKANKKKTPVKKYVEPIVEPENDSDFGDGSDSDGGAPTRYFAAVSPAPPRSASRQRSGMSAQLQRQRRDPSHDYQVDYDSIPAPRSASKTTTPQARNARNRATSSTLAAGNGSPVARGQRRADPIMEEDEDEDEDEHQDQDQDQPPFNDSNMSLTPPVEPGPVEESPTDMRRRDILEESPVGDGRRAADERSDDDDDSGPEGFEPDFGGDDEGVPPPQDDYDQEPERSPANEVASSKRGNRLPSPILEENEEQEEQPEEHEHEPDPGDDDDDREEVPGVFDQQPDEDESEEEVELPKPRRNGKENKDTSKRQPLRPRNPNVRTKRTWTLEDDNEDEDGVRRSKRRRFSPLQWWRGERLIIRRPRADEAPVPIVKDVLRFPQEDEQPLGAKRRGRKASSKPPSSRDGRKKSVEVYVENPEEGWDEETEPIAMVLDYETKEQIEKRIAQPAGLVNPQQPPGQEYAFQKIFLDEEFVAAGVMSIPVGGKKPTKGARDNTY